LRITQGRFTINYPSTWTAIPATNRFNVVVVQFLNNQTGTNLNIAIGNSATIPPPTGQAPPGQAPPGQDLPHAVANGPTQPVNMGQSVTLDGTGSHATTSGSSISGFKRLGIQLL
jgi:hypothetical protein